MADTALGPVLRTVQFDAVDGKKNAEGWSSMFQCFQCEFLEKWPTQHWDRCCRTVQFDAVDGKKNAEGWSSMFQCFLSVRVTREMADTALGPILPYGSV